MPQYQVIHAVPLTTQQKDTIAKEITRLHATTFSTPSFFVQVHFRKFDASAEDYYVAGERLAGDGNGGGGGANYIVGNVRTSATRSKADFDTLASHIEHAWDFALGGSTVGREEREGMKLRMVWFSPMVAVRELGLEIPEAGKEGEWMAQKRAEFESRAESDEFVKGMLEEVDSREDLKGVWKP